MNPSTCIPIIIIFIIIFILLRNRRTIIARKVIEKRKTEGNTKMIELAKRFIDKECVIYAFDSNQFDGVIKEVTNGAILIEKEDGNSEAINLDFVIRIREYPRNKKGKKKIAVFD